MTKLVKLIITISITSVMYYLIIHYIFLPSRLFNQYAPDGLGVMLFSGLFIVLGEYFIIFQKGKVPSYKGDLEVVQYKYPVMGMPFAKDKTLESVEGTAPAVKAMGSCLVTLGLLILVAIILLAV